MKYFKFKLLLSFFIVVFTSLNISAQVLVDTTKGNHNQSRKGFMDGNLVYTVYYNFGEIADWQNEPSRSGVWPKGTNHTYVDGIAVIVQAETKDPLGNILHPLETNYYENTRFNPSTGVTYGWWPLPGYAAPYSSLPARSDDNSTWPLTWPDRPFDWNAKWDGFFGKGVKNADLETFFVMDDNEDREYILNNNFHPDAEDLNRGGLGMQVKVRGFQWSQVLAEDVIFWLYNITNMGTTDYSKTLFAQYIDWGIGGHDNSSNNAGDYNELLDISYAWSTVSFGSPGNWSPVGLSGYAFLESPGKSNDRIDNDSDGLTDEVRDNVANNFISDVNSDPFIVNAIRDTINFKSFYSYSWRPHWDADENANWRSFTDLNNNGTWDKGEPLNDDVGVDGIGPFNENYTGPDVDGSEADGKPEQGEPNFGILDKDESDQLGLTGFAIFAVHTYDLNNDANNWDALSNLPSPHGQSLVGVNLGNYFSSYLFKMDGRNTYSNTTGQIQETGESQGFSMALLFGIDKNDLFRRKKTIQQIYNANYRFAKPPDKPIVTTIAGDHKVTLYWDDRAEKTFDAFYQRVNFEGYRIYRSTESSFIENKIITDAFGKPTFRKPIAQFDLVDGVTEFHPIDVNGVKFYLGNDSGIKHSFVDTTVQNGQTYYYAVSAYDKGFFTTTVEGTLEGIPPSETTTILRTDINGKVIPDINTAVVTPHTPAAGYLPPEINDAFASGPGTGQFSIQVLNPELIRNNSAYRLEFLENTPFHNNHHPDYLFINVTTGDTLISGKQIESEDNQTPISDGFIMDITADTSVTVDFDKSGWTKGNSNYIVNIGFDPRFAPAYNGKRVYYPADFEIHLKNHNEGDLSFPATGFSNPIQSNVMIDNLTEESDHFQFIFKDQDNDGMFTDGDAVFLVSGDSLGKRATSFSNLKVTWSISFIKDTTIADQDQRPPQIGDVYKIVTKKPFRNGEFFEFKTKGQELNINKAKTDLDKIAVVPNPYVGAASWEPFTNVVGRGERKIDFIHLPQTCTIRIYTISGVHVKTLYHNSTIDDGREPWDMNSKDGMAISYGVYIYHVNTPNIGDKIGRFAIIK